MNRTNGAQTLPIAKNMTFYGTFHSSEVLICVKNRRFCCWRAVKLRGGLQSGFNAASVKTLFYVLWMSRIQNHHTHTHTHKAVVGLESPFICVCVCVFGGHLLT